MLSAALTIPILPPVEQTHQSEPTAGGLVEIICPLTMATVLPLTSCLTYYSIGITLPSIIVHFYCWRLKASANQHQDQIKLSPWSLQCMWLRMPVCTHCSGTLVDWEPQSLFQQKKHTHTWKNQTYLPYIPLGFLFLIHNDGYTVRELGPVRVQSAAPAGGEPGVEPGLLFPRSVARAFLLPRLAVTRLLQANIPHQVSPESGSSGLLDVQKHDHVVPFDEELHVSVEVSFGEVELWRLFRRAVVLQVLVSVEIVAVLVRGGEQAHPPEFLPSLKVARITARGTDVLVPYHNKKDR